MSTKTKIPALSPIKYQPTAGQLIWAFFEGLTKRELVAVCKDRSIPVAKDKFDMASRLANDILSRGQTIYIVVK